MQLRLIAKAMSSSVGLLKWPYRMTFLISKESHSRCQNCNIWKAKPAGELSLEEIRTIAAGYPFVSWLTLTGGEPTDRRDIAEIARAFRDTSPGLSIVNLSTNGLNTARIVETAKSMLSLGLPRLVLAVSIDGPSAVNDEIRGL